MNNKVIFAMCGFAAGAVVGIFATKNYYERIANEEIESVKEAFGDALDQKAAYYEKVEDYSGDDVETKVIRKSEGQVVDYTAFSKPSLDDVAKEKLDDGGEHNDGSENGYYESVGDEEQIFERFDVLSDLYDAQYEDVTTVTYYTADSTFVDEDQEIIDDPDAILGEHAVQVAMFNKAIILQDNEMERVIDIEIDNRSASEVLYGITPEPIKSPQERLRDAARSGVDEE